VQKQFTASSPLVPSNGTKYVSSNMDTQHNNDNYKSHRRSASLPVTLSQVPGQDNVIQSGIPNGNGDGVVTITNYGHRHSPSVNIKSKHEKRDKEKEKRDSKAILANVLDNKTSKSSHKANDMDVRIEVEDGEIEITISKQASISKKKEVHSLQIESENTHRERSQRDSKVDYSLREKDQSKCCKSCTIQ